MRVELLFTEDDPGYMTARQNLVEVLTEDAFETTIQMIAVTSLADAELLGFPGSPTIRIDGEDIDPPPGDEPIGLTCRVYRLRDGRFSPTPDPAVLRAALENAMTRSTR